MPIEDFKKFSNFVVETCLTIIEKFNLQALTGDKSKPPDHSVVSCEFKISWVESCQREEIIETDHQIRYKMQHIPVDFMSTDATKANIEAIIREIEHARDTQENINKIYDDVCELIIGEMENHLDKTHPPGQLRKRYKPRKAFWNTDLDIKYKKYKIVNEHLENVPTELQRGKESQNIKGPDLNLINCIG